jgi:hypothetical protein
MQTGKQGGVAAFAREKRADDDEGGEARTTETAEKSYRGFVL